MAALAATSILLLWVIVFVSIWYVVRERARTLELKQSLARQLLHSAQAFCEQGDSARGLHGLVRSLRETPEHSAALLNDIRQNLGNWANYWQAPRAVLKSQYEVTATALSPDGRTAVTGDRRGQIQFWSAETGEPSSVTIQHVGANHIGPEPGAIRILFSPDGTRLVSAGGGQARIWTTDQGGTVGESIQHPGIVDAVFSADGTRLLTLDDRDNESTVRIWNVNSGRQIGRPITPPGRLWKAVFSPNGQRILTGCGDKMARLWDANTGLQIGTGMRHNHEVVDVAFSPDGRLALTASQDKTARLWNGETGEAAGQIMFHAREVWVATFSPDGQQVLTGSADGTARLWDGHSGEPLLWDKETEAPVATVFEHGGSVRRAGFSADGRWIFTASDDRKVRLWSANTREPLGHGMHHDEGIQEVHVRGGTVFVHEHPSDTLKITKVTDPSSAAGVLWNIDAKSASLQSLRYRAPYGDLTPEALAFSPDGKRLLMGDHLGGNWWWSIETGQIEPAGFQHTNRVCSISFSSDGEKVLIGNGDGTARLWSLKIGEPLAVFPHEGRVKAVLSKDAKLVATCGGSTVAIWSPSRTGSLGPLLKHPAAVSDASFSPDGTSVVTACEDGLARTWSVRRGLEVGGPLRHGGALRAVGFSPDGKLIATGSTDKMARLWHAATGLPTGTVLEHKAGVVDLAFSPDGRLLATASGEGDDRVRLWSPVTGELLGPPVQACCDVSNIDFSRDGTRLAVGGFNVYPTLWQIAPPFPDNIAEALLRVEVLTWHQMDGNGMLQPLTSAAWQERRAQLERSRRDFP